MQLTVLQQQTKALQSDQAADGGGVSKSLESIKHPLWHGNVDEALDRISNLLLDLDLMPKPSLVMEKLAAGIAEFETYIRNNREINSEFRRARSARGNDQHSVRGIDHQPGGQPAVRQETADGVDVARSASVMADSDEGSQRGPDDVFRRWYPRFRPQPQTIVPASKAA
jgi:hypothetical protein